MEKDKQIKIRLIRVPEYQSFLLLKSLKKIRKYLVNLLMSLNQLPVYKGYESYQLYSRLRDQNHCSDYKDA